MDEDQLCFVLRLSEAGPALWSGMENLPGIVLTPNPGYYTISGQTITGKIDQHVFGALAFPG